MWTVKAAMVKKWVRFSPYCGSLLLSALIFALCLVNFTLDNSTCSDIATSFALFIHFLFIYSRSKYARDSSPGHQQHYVTCLSFSHEWTSFVASLLTFISLEWSLECFQRLCKFSKVCETLGFHHPEQRRKTLLPPCLWKHLIAVFFCFRRWPHYLLYYFSESTNQSLKRNHEQDFTLNISTFDINVCHSYHCDSSIQL